MPGGVRQDYSQQGGHRWRILPLPNASIKEGGAIKASIVDNVNQQVTIIEVGTQAAVIASTLTTIMTYTALVRTLVPRIVISGDLPAKVFLVFNTVTIETRRLTASREVEFGYIYPMFMEIGDIVDIKVQHEFAGETGAYESTLHGLPSEA